MIQEAWQSYLERESSPTASNAQPAGSASAGITRLPALTVAAFEGPDVRRFLQGYLTCDTTALDAARAVPAAICSLKGRVVVNGWCLAPTAEQVLFVIDESLFEPLAALLKVYLRFSRTRLTDLRGELLVFGGLDLPADAGGIGIDADRRLYLCNTIEDAAELWRAQPHIEPDAWAARLIADGIPLVTAATSDAFLPQMLNLPELGAINFNKGCYLGQEVVARAQHRGQVKRHLLRLSWQGSAAPAPGAELTDAGGRSRAVVIQASGHAGGTALAVVQDETAYPLRLDDTEFTPAT
jgi:tRNA-modifying protein YgfZ